ncbi:MAG: Gfo/Idh/MocA family oxidoreductase [Acidobacteria bacterium]|nr:Gfo/Idh/MocA family oxidoreductase [Acidobacteriota bacterium]
MPRFPVYNAGVKPAVFFLLACALPAADLRIGIVGTDTSHVPAFAKMLHDESLGAKVVAAWKGGSKDFEASATRVDQFAVELQAKYGVEIVPDLNTMLGKVDAVMLESVDGRVHLEQARAIIAAKKPVFIDKPLAASLDDAREIARLAKAAGVPWFSTSSLRYGAIGAHAKFSDTTGAAVWGPGTIVPQFPLDLSWYVIHPIEVLYTILGRGCVSVSRTSTANGDVIVGRWQDGRIGTVYAARPNADYGAVVFRGHEVTDLHPKKGEASEYRPLLLEIVKFFQTGKPPVDNEETLEIMAFMDAGLRSKQQGGAPVALR